MPPFAQNTVVIRSYKLRIKNKYKSIVEETEDVVTLLQSCVSSFGDRVTALVENNDENFFSSYEKLSSDIERHQDKLFLLLASIEKDDETEVEQVDENHCEKLGTDLQKGFQSHLDQSCSSQTFCKTFLPSQTSSTSTASYCSVQDFCNVVSQSELYEVPNIVRVSSRASIEDCIEKKHINSAIPWTENLTNVEHNILPYSEANVESHSSASQSSCYQSILSNKLSNVSINITNSLETLEYEKLDSCKPNPIGSDSLILPLSISIPSIKTATLSHIISPDDFWMQFDGTPTFPIAKYGKKTPPSHVQPGDFCLALSSRVNIYNRAKVLTEVSSDEKVEVLFIDHGSIQNVSVQNLRELPKLAYQIPMQAIHCCLCDISPVSGTWTSASIEKFKEYEPFSCEIYVKSLNCDKYAVDLMIQNIMGFTNSAAEILCAAGFATFNEVSAEMPTSVIEMANQVSHDSGVSITSNQRTSPDNERLCISSEMLADLSMCMSSEPLNPLRKNIFPQLEQAFKLESKLGANAVSDLISFESAEEVYDALCEPVNGTENKNICFPNRCLKTVDCGCALHLVIPPPTLSFVEKNMMVVLPSIIVSPSEFYVNAAMKDSCTLDELCEQMNASYDSRSQSYQCVAFDDLQEGMFCAGLYDQDQNWYRVKILQINLESQESDIYVQYIDYGNKESIKCCNLRLLTPQFAEHPSFAIKCSLAGIIPKASQISTSDEMLYSWSENAVKQFQELISYQRFLTAQVGENMPPYLSSESEPIEVLLWDTNGTQDLLINEALVESGVANFDCRLVSNIQDENGQKHKEVEVLNQWDPMYEEFVGIENSYGVDTDEVQVAISGYKQNDESYVCKYFSLRGSCPRKNCKYDHVPLAEGGVTRDQEETYLLDPIPPLPDSSSVVLIQVSAVYSPGHFYSILPFGSKSVDTVDRDKRGGSDDSLVKNEVMLLYHALNQHYSNSPFTENTAIALSCGSIIVAWRSLDSAWHRGRIIDVSGIKGPSQVFFVDFGDDEWVPRKKIREILPEYLHTPFQAVECHLSDVEPLGFESGTTWSTDAINYFKELVTEEIFLAHITDRCGKVLNLTLRKTCRGNYDSISESLVRRGFAQYRPLVTSKKKETIYAPG